MISRLMTHVGKMQSAYSRLELCSYTYTHTSHQGDSLGGQVQHFDLVVVGVGHVEKLAAVTSTDSSRFIEAGLVKIRAKSISSLSGPC